VSGTGEFAFISQSLAPLSAGYEGAFDLTDDAAFLAKTAGLIATTDTLVQGVHFRIEDPLDLVARKALRVNISDLVAMAATPHAFMMSIVWPDDISSDDQKRFVEGLAVDAHQFSIPLIGGDTTRGGDRLVVTITAFGECERPLRRNTARPGDRVFVSGTIGDGYLGLQSSTLNLPDTDRRWLDERYQLPEARTSLIGVLRELASAGLDISDGLIADAGHLARTSGVALEIDLTEVPISNAAQSWLKSTRNRQECLVSLITGGDDYEILFCVPDDNAEAMMAAARAVKTKITEIGRVQHGEGVRVLDESGEIVQILRTGFTHF